MKSKKSKTLSSYFDLDRYSLPSTHIKIPKILIRPTFCYGRKSFEKKNRYRTLDEIPRKVRKKIRVFQIKLLRPLRRVFKSPEKSDFDKIYNILYSLVYYTLCLHSRLIARRLWIIVCSYGVSGRPRRTYGGKT